MGDLVNVRINGLREIQAAMAELPRRVDKKVMDAGLLDGARIVRDDAKNRVPLLKEPDARRRRGTLRRAIRAGRVRPTQYAATVWVRIRQLSGRQRASFKAKNRGAKGADNPNDPFYWRFVEFGTSKMPAKPFLRPAFEARKTEAVNKAIATFRTRIQAEIVKIGSRARGGR